MNNLEAVIFDLGNVLLTLDWDRPARRFEARTGKTRQQLDDYFARTPWVNDLSVGKLDKQQFYKNVAGDLGFTGSYEEFAETWSNMFEPNDPMIALAQRLKGQLPRVILSNTNAIHIEYVLDRYPFLHEFDGYIYSHEVGLAKPDGRIYELTLRRHSLTAARSVFIDDLPENVAGARAVGMHAIQYQSAPQTSRELTNLGLSFI